MYRKHSILATIPYWKEFFDFSSICLIMPARIANKDPMEKADPISSFRLPIVSIKNLSKENIKKELHEIQGAWFIMSHEW